MLEPENVLPEGVGFATNRLAEVKASRAGLTLLEQLGDLVDTVLDLPPDMADQHGHYLHGAAKR